RIDAAMSTNVYCFTHSHFIFHHTPCSEPSTLSLHDALPIYGARQLIPGQVRGLRVARHSLSAHRSSRGRGCGVGGHGQWHGDSEGRGEATGEELLHRISFAYQLW